MSDARGGLEPAVDVERLARAVQAACDRGVKDAAPDLLDVGFRVVGVGDGLKTDDPGAPVVRRRRSCGV